MDLVIFVEEIIRDIIDDEVLYPFAPYFTAKKQIIEELNSRKKIN